MDAPTIVKLIEVPPSNALIYWNKSVGATEYYLYYRTFGGVWTKLLTPIPPMKIQYTRIPMDPVPDGYVSWDPVDLNFIVLSKELNTDFAVTASDGIVESPLSAPVTYYPTPNVPVNEHDIARDRVQIMYYIPSEQRWKNWDGSVWDAPAEELLAQILAVLEGTSHVTESLWAYNKIEFRGGR